MPVRQFSTVVHPYPGRADHLQRHRVAFNFSDVAIDLVGGETYVLTLLLVRHVRQDQSLPVAAFQRHSAVGEDLGPSGSMTKRTHPPSHFNSTALSIPWLPRAIRCNLNAVFRVR